MVREDDQSYTAHLALALAYRLSGPEHADAMAKHLAIARQLAAGR